RRGSGVRFVYLLAVYLAAPLVSTMLLWRGLRDRSYWHDFGERFGFGARLAPLGVWMHAVSVGEVQACAPLVSALARRHPHLPLVLASARVSERSVGRYRRLGALFRATLSEARVVAAQGAGDAYRFRALGADPASTHVTGNLKFDFDLPPGTLERGARLREQYAPHRPLWVAGSTHGGAEEQAIIEAQRRVHAAHPGALLVIAPRHPQRF